MRIRVVVVSLLAATALTGCASAFDDIPYADDAMPTATPAPKCGDDTVQAVADVMTPDAVEVVQVIAGCTKVYVGTSLGPADKDAARAVCDAAAEVAYVGEIESIIVDGRDERKLATGVKGSPCV
ncbi:MAG: hypothetical protein SYR96_26550 [Actinomycetota bacterium]|nr:hypothetical protein [Actinomycetota bacterium]